MEQDNDKTHTHIVLTNGTMVSHYRIVEKIGAGGMGEVYLAEDTKLKRQVALKFLPQHLSVNDDAKARFTREAQAAAALKQPNIVTIYEVSEFQGRPFFAMEHIEGQSLRDLIRDKELRLDKVIDFAIQVCEGLSKAHQVGITHRDIKPSNIVIDADGRPKLLDFGLAAVKGAEQLTKTGSTLGTTGYMSPEQARGQKVDQRSDIFSLGVVLYEMVTGRRPFKGEDDAATLHAITHDAPEPLARYKTDVPDELQQIVDRALEKDVETRYQTASGMLADLKRLAAFGPRPVTVSARASRAKKLRWAAALSLLIITVVSVGFLLKHFLAPGELRVKSLAVLFFENLGTEDESYLANGLAEDLAMKLRNIAGFQVASSADIRRLSKKDLLAKDVASHLGVQYALGGSLLRHGERIRVNVELIDEKTGEVIWSEQFNRQFTEVFQFIDEVSRKIAQALEVHLIPAEQLALKEKPTDNPEAYDHYLKGRHYYYRVTFRDNELAEKEFQKALQLDPDYPLALAGLADAYVQRYRERYDYDEFWLDTTDQLIDRALVLDPDLAEAYEARAEVLLEKENLLGALEAAEKAMNLRSDLDEPYVRLGEIYQQRGEYRKALEMFNAAMSIRPSVDALCGKGNVFRTSGDLDSAEAAYHAALEINPDYDRPYCELAGYYWELGQLQDAEKKFRSAIELRPDRGRSYEDLMWLMLVLPGDRIQEAEQLLQGFVEEYPYSWDAYQSLYRFFAWGIGDYPAAVEVVKQAVDKNPDRAWPHLLLAESYAYKTAPTAETESAIRAVERALELRPNSSRVLKWAGDVYAVLDSADEAMNYFGAGLEINPGSASILASMGRVLLKEGRYDSAVVIATKAIEQTPGIPGRLVWQSNYALLREALAHLQRTEEYLDILLDAANKYGEENPEFFVDLGRELCLAGQFKEAIALYQRLLNIKIGGHSLMSLGMAQWLSGDTEGALNSFYKARETDARFASYPRELRIISLLKYLRRFDQIERRLESIRDAPNVELWRFITSNYYGSMRRYDDALAVSAETTMGSALRKANLYRLKGDLHKAKQAVEEAYPSLSASDREKADRERAMITAIEGNLPKALLLAQEAGANSLIAKLQFALGRTEEALAKFTQASRWWDSRSGTGLSALYDRAQLERVSATDEAERHLEKTLLFATRTARTRSGFTDLGEARSFCALASARLGNSARARDEIEYAMQLEPERADIAYNAACAYSLMGDTALALQWLETAVERGHQELWWARVDPDLDPLRELPRFKEIMTDWDGRIQAMLEKSGKD